MAKICSDPSEHRNHARYERRVAWFTALWAAVALVSAAAELLRWV